MVYATNQQLLEGEVDRKDPGQDWLNSDHLDGRKATLAKLKAQGWPIFFDITIAEFRPVTQLDWNIAEFSAAHAHKLWNKIEVVRQKHFEERQKEIEDFLNKSKGIRVEVGVESESFDPA